MLRYQISSNIRRSVGHNSSPILLRQPVRSKLAIPRRPVRFNSSKSTGSVPPPGASSSTASKTTASAPKKGSLRELLSKYGYSAVGVYVALTALDYPICLLIVHSMGQEKIAELEKSVKGYFGYSTKTEDLATQVEEDDDKGKKTSSMSTLLTEMGVAYVIHKSLIVFRLPATAAITPWAVKTLQGWGFKIGQKSLASAAGATTGSTANAKQRFGSWFF